MKRTWIRETLVNLALQPRNAAKSLTGLMPGTTTQGLTVLALDGRWLKVLQADGPPNARKITKLLALPVAGAGMEEILKAFKEACAAEGLLPRDVLVANPTHLSTIRFFSLPSTDPKEIRDIVELQAEKHTPYAKEEILMDFKVIERERAGYSRVLLVIAHQDVLHRSVRLVELSEWPLDRVGCEVEGLVNWFQLAKKGAAAPASAGGSLVVDVDGSTTTLMVMQRAQPQFQRSLATGAEQLAGDPAQAGERLVSELKRSLEALDAEGGAVKIQDVLLTGCSERLEELKALIERGLDLPVNLISSWAGRTVSESVQAAANRLPEVSFASLVGLAFAPSQIDLTPQTTKLRQAFEARAKALVLLGCQCVGALILFSILIVGRVQKEHRYYEALKKVYSDSAAEARDLEAAIQEIEFVETRLHNRGHLLGTVNTLSRLSSADIQWKTLTFTEGEGVLLKGASSALPKIYEFVAALDGSPLFGQVEAKRVAKRKSGDWDVTDFEVTCPFPNEKATP